MDHVIGGTDFQGSIEQAIDNALGKAKASDQIVLTHAAAVALLSEIDELRDSDEPMKPRFLHVMSKDNEQVIRVEMISCAAVDPSGKAAVLFAGGGMVQFDALAWRLLFSHIKQYADIEMVPVAPPSTLGS